MIRVAIIVLVALAVSPIAAENNPFVGIRSIKIKMHRDRHPERWCTRNWWNDIPEKYWILCKGK